MALSACAASSSAKRSPTIGLDEARFGQAVDLGADLVVELGLAQHEAAPAGAHDLDVVEQQPVDPHLGDRPAGEADDDCAPALAQRAQAVGEAIAADRVEDDVDAAARELLRLVLPRPVRAHDLVGAGVARHLLLRVARHDGDRLRPQPLGDLQRRRADPAGGPMDEDGLALGEPPAELQREVGGVVVEDQPGALREVQLVREREGQPRRRDGHLGEAAEHAERGDAVARREPRAVRRTAHDAGHLAARHERQRRLELVLPARLQHLGEGDARGAHVDEHALAGRHRMGGLGLGDVDELERRLGARQVLDLDRAHGRRHATLRSPPGLDAVGTEARIGRDDRHPLGQRLRDEQAVEGIAMMRRQLPHPPGVLGPPPAASRSPAPRCGRAGHRAR